MLLSHCGEYMANGLTNAVRHEFVMIANDRQTFVAVRKHSRSFLWCFECYAGLTSGECMANELTNAIRHQFASRGLLGNYMVSPRMRCVVVSFVRHSPAFATFARFARAFVSIRNIRKGFTRNSPH